MRKILPIILLVAMVPYLAWGQSSEPFIFHQGATGNADGNIMNASYYSTIVVQIEGTFTGEVFFEKKTKDATGWVGVECTNAASRSTSATSATATGYWECPGGTWNFRARVTHSSGTIVVTGHGTTAVSRSSGGGGGGGSGTVTSVSASGGVETTTGSAITGSGTIRGNMCVRAVTGTTDTILSTDRGCIVTYSNASPIAVTLPQAGTAGFDAGFWFQPVNIGVGDVVITPTTSTIQGDTDLTLVTDRGITVASDGTNYVHNPGLGLTAESQALQSAFSFGKEITGANSLANAFRVGDGTTPICVYTDATEGPLIRPCTASNTRTHVLPNFTWGIKDDEGDADMFVVDPDAANEIDMWAFQAGYRPFKSVYVPASLMHGDGTNCPARPTIVTISNDPKPTFICTENNGSRMKFSFPMRGDWDAGQIFVKPYYAQTAADTGSVALEIAAACRPATTAFNGTYGTEVEVDDAALVGSGAIESTLSGAITPDGTCAASDWLFVYIDVDATDNPTTAAATLNFIGADVFWRGKSFSHK